MIIYYFSGTGNSLYLTKHLAKEFDAKILPMTKNDKSEAARVGFVFPMYYSNMPLIVADFIQSFDFTEVEYIFAICCRGAPAGGGVSARIPD